MYDICIFYMINVKKLPYNLFSNIDFLKLVIKDSIKTGRITSR